MASVSKREWTYKGETKSAWIVRYVDQGGTHRQRTFEKKKDADTYRRKVETEIESGLHAPEAKNITVGALAEQYLNAYERMHRDGRISYGTLKKERFYFDGHIIPKMATLRLSDLSKNHVDDFLTGLRDGEKLKGQGILQPATIKQITQAFARSIDFAMRRGMVAKNVVREVGQWAEHRNGKNPPIRTFKIEDVKTLLVNIETRRSDQGERSAALTRATVYLAAFCGLRLGEVLGLTWPCVDFERRVIKVRHSLDAWDNLKSPKTAAGRRDVPMPEPVFDALRVWKKHYRANDRQLLFRSRTGNKLSTANFHKNYWQKALEDAGLGPKETGDRFHFHALRHFAASMMIESHIPLADVASLLGHASFDMTLQVYAHPMVGG